MADANCLSQSKVITDPGEVTASEGVMAMADNSPPQTHSQIETICHTALSQIRVAMKVNVKGKCYGG